MTMRKSSKPHPSLNLRCKLYLKLHGVGILMMCSFLLGRGLAAKAIRARSCQSSQVALLASLEDLNCTGSKLGRWGRMAVVAELKSKKPQHYQIQTAKVAESVQKGIDLGREIKVPKHFLLTIIHVRPTSGKDSSSPSLKFSPCFEM